MVAEGATAGSGGCGNLWDLEGLHLDLVLMKLVAESGTTTVVGKVEVEGAERVAGMTKGEDCLTIAYSVKTVVGLLIGLGWRGGGRRELGSKVPFYTVPPTSSCEYARKEK